MAKTRMSLKIRFMYYCTPLLSSDGKITEQKGMFAAVGRSGKNLKIQGSANGKELFAPLLAYFILAHVFEGQQ